MALPRSVLAELDALEKAYRQRLPTVELLGEITISDEDRLRLGSLLGSVIESGDVDDACRWPTALSVFLVAQGVCEYQGGDYWGAISARTGLPVAKAWVWGQCFEALLSDAGLWEAKELDQEGALRYVAKILAHGGIPRYCQNQFFEFLLATTAGGIGSRAGEIIEEWRFYPQSLQTLSQPVRRFLLYGRQVAEDFVERCQELLEFAQARSERPSAAELGLPETLVSQFEDWWASRDGAGSEVPGNRWLRPRFVLHPWDGDGPVMDLPEQVLDLPEGVGSATWVLAQGEDLIRRKVGVYRKGHGFVTEYANLPISPASDYRIAVDCGGVQQSWHISGLGCGVQALAFAQDTGLLTSTRRLPAKPIWLVVPQGTQASVVDQAGSKYDLDAKDDTPVLRGTWSGFEVWAIDLTTAIRLVLRHEGAEREIPLVVGEMARPRLVGGGLVPLVLSPTDVPVYCSLPALQIPGLAGQDIAKLSHYSISVMPEPLAEPRFVRLSELRDQLSISEEHGWELSLSKLVSPGQLGEFMVRLRAPIGRDARIRFLVVPGLQIVDHLVPIIAAADRANPFRFTVELPEGLSCRGGDGTRCQREVVRNRYAVTTEGRAAFLRITCGDAVVPLLLRARYLTWSLTHTDMISADERGRSVSVEDIETAAPEVCVHLVPSPLAEQVFAILQLWRDGCVVQSEEGVLTSQGSGFARFSLARFLGTLREGTTKSQHFRLQIVRGRERVVLPILTCRASIVFEDVECEARPTEDSWLVNARWSQSRAAEDSALRWWPLSRPWEPVYTQWPAGSEETTWQSTIGREALRPGQYLLEVCVDDGWSSELPRRPRPAWPNVCRCVFPELSLPARTQGDEPPALSALANLLTNGEGSQDIPQICALIEEQGAHAIVRALVDVDDLLAGSFDFVSLQRPQLEALYRELGRNPGLVFNGVARCYESGNLELRERLVNLVFASGALQQPMASMALDAESVQRLWDLWLPLGLIADSEALVRGEPEAWRRAGVALGLEGPDEVINGDVLFPFEDSEWLFQMRLRANQEETSLSQRMLAQIHAQVQRLGEELRALPPWARDPILRLLPESGDLDPWSAAVLVAGCQRSAALGIADLNNDLALLYCALRCHRFFPANYAVALAAVQLRLALQPWTQGDSSR